VAINSVGCTHEYCTVSDNMISTVSLRNNEHAKINVLSLSLSLSEALGNAAEPPVASNASAGTKMSLARVETVM